ncbi:MAG: hypothetical protein LC725_08110 [Lentisphaerae bacterium]|nr:hypothetical protein [Lentisphaerota bacterium]
MPIGVKGRFIRGMASDSDYKIRIDDAAPTKFQTGIAFSAPTWFNRLEIINPAAIAQEIEVIVAALMSSVTPRIDLAPVEQAVADARDDIAAARTALADDVSAARLALANDTATLLGRLTATRAGNLDASISSRASQTSVNTVDSVADTIAGRLTAARAGKLDNLNATISSRSSQTSVNAVPLTPIKSVQRGYTNRAAANYTDVTISAINTSKAWVNVMADQDGLESSTVDRAHAEFLNSTTMRLYSRKRYIHVRWEIIEYV